MTNSFLKFLSTSSLLLWVGIASAAPVDTARLRAASNDPVNWVTFGHDYSNQRYSALAKVHRGTVSSLNPKWLYQTGIVGTFQTHPLVVDGQMFITTPNNHVTALDGRTGAVIWHYQHEKRTEFTRGGPSNRGAGLGYGKIFQATNDGRLIALDRYSGALVWDSLIATPGPGEIAELAEINAEAQQAFIDGVDSFPAKMPPLVADGKVIAGVISAGYGLYHDIAALIGLGGSPEGDRKFGRRGYLAAFDAETGAEIWRWHTTKDKGWEGLFGEATPEGVPLNRRIDEEKLAAPSYSDSWRTGGGSTWMTPAYDPELGLIYLGTGNASPADADFMRPGDNLYTSSLVALEIGTGTLRWHFQIVPHDIWGYDTASPPILFELPSDQRTTLAVGVPSKNGWFYALDRQTGDFLFKSEPFVPQSNLFARASPQGVVVAPGSFGGASWSPSSYDPTTG
ncbi:MAG: Quinohemoprotein alcohol dehydrogenase ADH-IIG, partial [Alphaproteobacteria bacterium MarineAlpha9_Bin7]